MDHKFPSAHSCCAIVCFIFVNGTWELLDTDSDPHPFHLLRDFAKVSFAEVDSIIQLQVRWKEAKEGNGLNEVTNFVNRQPNFQ